MRVVPLGADRAHHNALAVPRVALPFDYSICSSVRSLTLPTGRTYPTPAGSFPSITTILGKTGPEKTGLIAWKERLGEEEARKQSKAAADRGTLVHAYLEAYLKLDADDDPSIDAWVAAVCNAQRDGGQTETMARNLRQAVRPHLTDIWCQETPLWSASRRFAGAVDCIGMWSGEPAVIDFKTSRRPKQDAWIQDYWLQTTGYSIAHDELFGTNIQNLVILITCETGEVQTFTGKVADYVDALDARIAEYYAVPIAA